jgi:hypothetical protein
MSYGTTTYLAEKNRHPRDEFITFEEGPHIYTVNGDRGGYTSVTTWNHHHFSDFDSEKVIGNILKSRNMSDPKYKYYGMTKEDIQQMWDTKRDSAAGAGTKMHQDIEWYYNGIEVNNDSIEFQYFRNFVADFPELKPYRTEWMVYYEELKISGSIDMVFENPEDGTIQIYDWKRCQEIKHETEFGKYAKTSCICHFPDTNFWHYALQLNMYRRILQDKYGKTVSSMYLVCLHPDNVYKNYERINVPVLDKEMDELLTFRMQEIETKKEKLE